MRRKRSAGRGVLEFVVIIIAAFAVAYLLQAFIVKPFQIPSESMENTLDVGDRVLVNRLAYRFSEPSRGDVIVFKSPEDTSTDLIKRVIAVGGDTIEVSHGNVFINGQMQVEDYIREALRGPDFPVQQVPEGTVFVMGDNRNNSRDSRFWKPPWVPDENIVGKAFMIYWPPQRITTL